MRCPECQTELPDTAKFCLECGRKLELNCSECGKTVPLASKFCLECGKDLRSPSATAPLKDLSFDEKLAKIQKYLPSGLTEKVLSQRDKIEGERRHVTIMFVDMKGFTPLAEKLGPEETFSLMDQVFEILIHKIHDYEGTVNELRGDGALALFGAPIALEDAPQRAIRSSLAIHREMAKFSEKVKAEKQIAPILVRIGINTGPVVVGTLGNDLRVQFTAVGDTINMAARMEQMAEPGTTYITEDTFKLTEGLFRFEALGERPVKGKDKLRRIYRVIAPSTRKTRFDVSAERGLSLFVGRERELEIILDAFERSKVGRGQAVSIVGEAGVGKSRLLYEFRKAVGNQDVTFLEGKCLSYGWGVAYHPFTDVLKANFGIEDEEADSDITEKVRRGLTVLGVDEACTVPYLLELLSVEDSGIDKIPMSPEARKDRIVESVKRMVLKGSEMRPLILAFEDLHWMDKSSEDLSKHLLESIAGIRVLLIFTYRPEFVHTWGSKSFHSQINLNRLSNRESLAMVTHLLGTEDMAGDLEDLILEKTEGIPFFIEEFVRSLKDLKIIERKGTEYRLAADRQQAFIPSTIQDVIMARVDSLPDGAKDVLQTSSVIQREFGYELIRRVTGLPEQELLSQLSALKDSELLYERGIYPESVYIFKHMLSREVIYDSILTTRKKTLHQEIAESLEDLYGENIDEYYEPLAEHYLGSENWDKGAEYLRLAGKKAVKRGSLSDAIACADKRVACLERLSRTDEVENRIIHARTALGLYHNQMNHHIQAKEAVDPIIDLAEKHDAKRRIAQIHIIRGAYYGVVQDFVQAVEELQKALNVSDEIKDVASYFFANLWLGVCQSCNCEFEKALGHFEIALNINVAANSLWGIATLKGLISHFVHGPQGRLNSAFQVGEQALRIAEHSGDTFSKAVAYASHGATCYWRGYLEEAQKYLSKATDSDVPPWNSFAQGFLGKTCFDMGVYENAKDHYHKAACLLQDGRLFSSLMYCNRIGVARAKVMNNESDIDLPTLRTHVSENRMKLYEGEIRRYMGEILLNVDVHHMSEAEDWIEEAIEADERNGMSFHLGRNYALYAELFERTGDTFKAKEQLGKAIEIYKDCGADGWVTKTEEEMAKLS